MLRRLKKNLFDGKPSALGGRAGLVPDDQLDCCDLLDFWMIQTTKLFIRENYFLVPTAPRYRCPGLVNERISATSPAKGFHRAFLITTAMV